MSTLFATVVRMDCEIGGSLIQVNDSPDGDGAVMAPDYHGRVNRRKTTGQDLQPADEQRLLAAALSAAANPAFIADHAGRIIWANAAFCECTGYSAQEAIGQTPRLLKSGRQDGAFYRELWHTILAGNPWRGEVVEKRKDGAFYSADQVITPLKNAKGIITHFVAIQHDVTARKQETEREHFLAYHDPLTGLYNRVFFMDLLQRATAQARRDSNSFALLYSDVDNFKTVNDTYGHEIGDRLLAAIAERLAAAVRKSTDAVARLSGDEFAILQADLAGPHAALALGRKLLDSVSQTFVLDGQRLQSGISIGIAVYPGDGDTPEQLLRNADAAMYQAKRSGRGNCALYDPVRCPRSLRYP